jgi:hypothetical protein
LESNVLQQKDLRFPLSCGIYTEQGKKPLLVAHATAYKVDNKPASPVYIRLTINAADGHENSPGLYGIKKLAIFSKGFSGNIFERLIELTENPVKNANASNVSMSSLIGMPNASSITSIGSSTSIVGNYVLEDITAQHPNKDFLDDEPSLVIFLF